MNVESSSLVSSEAPWPGLASFTEDQRAYFHGRDEEIIDLTQLAERRPLVVLFGQSGLGKSSILQAGVFPRLRADGFCPIYVRLDHGESAPPPAEQIKEMVRAETAKFGAWTKPGVARPGETLWEFFHHRDDRLVDRDGLGVVPVLVFDQFEELFTLGAGRGERRDRAVAFISELASLVENRPPAKLVARLEQSAEEMDAFDFGRTDYRVIISLREDFLPDLETLKTIMPALMQSRMRLGRMTGRQALDAVLKPGAALVEPDVARAIVEFVAGARGGSPERLDEVHVEPALLSVVCRELNERRRVKNQAKITREQVSGDRREILSDFYERGVADLPAAMRAFVEDKLLTKSGFRDNLALETVLEEPGVTRELIDTLVARRLLRIEDRVGTQRVELTHDVLAEVIRASRDARQQRQAVEQFRRRERLTRRRMWLARTIAAGLLVGLAGVSWIAWRAIRAEGEQARLRANESALRERAEALRRQAETQELAALRKAYASDMNGVQHALAVDNLARARELLYRHVPAPDALDLRGWEWRYLWQFCQSDAKAELLPPSEDSMMSLSPSSDGKWLAVGAPYRGRLTLLNFDSGQKIELPAGEANVHVAISPRAPLLAFTSQGALERSGRFWRTGNRLVFWDLQKRETVRQVDLEGPCVGIVFSEDGLTVVTNDSTAIAVWRVSDGARIAKWNLSAGGSIGFIGTRFTVARDLSLAAVEFESGRTGQIVLIDLKTGAERLLDVGSAISAVAFSPDHSTLATSSSLRRESASIELWDVNSGRQIGRLHGHRGMVGQLAFLSDGKRLVSAAADQTLRLWDLEQLISLRTFHGHKTEVWKVAVMPDQKTIVSGCKDGSVYQWDVETTTEKAPSGVVRLGGNAAFADGGASIVTIRNGKVMKLSGARYEKSESVLEDSAILGGVFDHHRSRVAVVTDAAIQVWDWNRHQLLRQFARGEPGDRKFPQHFSRDGAKLAIRAAGSGFRYRQWDIETGQEVRSFDFPPITSERPTGVYSPDGTQYLAIAFPAGECKLFDLQTGGVKRLDIQVRDAGVGPSFSADGRFIAIPSLRSFIQIFDPVANARQAIFGGYMYGVHSSAFSPDGARLGSGGTANEAVVLWDTQSHERLLTLAAEANNLSALIFSPDGSVLAGRGNNSQLFFWRAPTWAEIEAAERARGAKASE